MPLSPERQAREQIDAALRRRLAGPGPDEMNLAAGRGVAVREFKLAPATASPTTCSSSTARPSACWRPSPRATPSSSVELQADKYADGLPAGLNPPVDPLPVPLPEHRRRDALHQPARPRPEDARDLGQPAADPPARDAGRVARGRDPRRLGEAAARRGRRAHTAADDTGPRPSAPASRRCRRSTRGTLYPNQIEARHQPGALAQRNRPRALIQMATGSGKTIAAITAIYRLIKFGGARRVLFLVDRSNLGEQAEKEFQGYRTPDDNRKFTELYNVQRLTSNTIGASSQGRDHDHPAPLLDAQGRAGARPGAGGGLAVRDQRRRACKEPLPVVYNPRYPARVLRRDLHRRVPPLDLHALAAGAGVLRRLPRRPDRDARRSRPSASSTRTS